MSLSKDNSADEKIVNKSSLGSDITGIIYSAFKKVLAIGCIYYFGYMQWSVGWFVAPVVFLLMKEQWKENADIKRNNAKTAALSNEKEVILARLDELPSWVFFPDVERVEWLNKIIQQVWPNVNCYTRELIRDTIQPIIQSSLEQYKLKGFKFDRLILGSIPIRIGGAKVYDKNTDRNEIIMDLDIFYAGDCDITFYLSGIKGGIKDFQLKGMVRIIMKPLISTIPLVGGLQVFFLNNPEIDFNLVGVADFLDMPGLGDLLRKVITEIIASMMVLPNKLPIKLSQDIETEQIKAPEAEGVLRVHVVEAKHLMKKDIGVLGKGKSDPYAVITVGAQEYKTSVIKNTVDPKWDNWCEFYVMDSMGQQVFIHLWDKDDAMDDESLGRATVEISKIKYKKELDTWITLEQASHGMVHLRFTWFSLSDNLVDLRDALKEFEILGHPPIHSALISVFLDSAKALPLARHSSQPDPYAIITLGNITHQTQIIMRSPDPVWEEGFLFLVTDPSNDTLHVKIMDKKTGHDIGQLDYPLKNLLLKEALEINKQPFKLNKSGPDSKLVWSLHLKIFKVDKPVSVTENKTEDEPDIEKEATPLLEKKNSPLSKSSFKKQPSSEKSESDFRIENSPTRNIDIASEDNSSNNLVRRTPSVTSSAGEAGLGRIQLTLQYSTQRQKLAVLIHKIANIPLKDPTNIPDPYVKLYFLPERSKETKRRTGVIKDNCNPTFEESFEYLLSQNEMHSKKLEVTVCTEKKLFYSSSNILGQVVIDLSQLEFNQQHNCWYDLLPGESHSD